MRRIFTQSTLLIASLAFVFVWQNTFLSQYTLQLLIVLSIIYILLALKRKNFDLIATMKNDVFGLTILTTVVVLVVMMSGNYSSPVYFLLYFLSFGIAFAYEPSVIFIYTLGIATLLFPFTFKEDSQRNILMFGSLIAIAPIAFFFGRTYVKEKK